MLKSLTLNFSETGAVELSTKGVTIFVGPNNSGKSLALREIEAIFVGYGSPNGPKIVTDFEIIWPNEEEVIATLNHERLLYASDLPQPHFTLSRVLPNGLVEQVHVHEPSFMQSIRAQDNKRWVAETYLKRKVLRLDGKTRFDLSNDQNGGDLISRPANILQILFQNDQARFRVREVVRDALGLFFVVDPTKLGTLRIRLSRDIPPADEQSLNVDARRYHSAATHIKDASDGVQAFVGIASAIEAGEFELTLIDEPEAFLHPPLARKLGRHLSSRTMSAGGSLLAATHSADFLMGCMQGSGSVQVVRLEYSEGKSRAKVINATELLDFFKRPLIRSANVISGLFYDGVVVVESDNDRAFYSEIYYRLGEAKPDLPSLLFVNARSVDTIPEIMGPMRSFGVPTAGIADIDVIANRGKNWTKWLDAARVPQVLHMGLGQQASAIVGAFTAAGAESKQLKNGGVKRLHKQTREAAEVLLDGLKPYGMFVVDCGELEHWLSSLNVPGAKTDWTIGMLERLGSDPMDPNYVRPGDDDVWAFLLGIAEWVRNPARKGMI